MEAEERPDECNRAGEEEALRNRSLLVLYGTETGNSQEIAQEISRAAERLRFQTDIEEMNDVPLVSPTLQSINTTKGRNPFFGTRWII